MDMLSLIKLNCIFFFLLFCSCSENKTQINSKEIELTTVNDRNMTCVYVKGDEVLSDMCFAFFKVSKGTILRVEPVDYYPNAYTKNIRNKKAYEEKLKSEGKVSKKDKISQRRAKIKDLLDKGLSQKEIYLSLNISKRTCINDIKYLKEQGLI